MIEIVLQAFRECINALTIDLVLQAGIFVTGITGQLLIAHKRQEAFYVWIATNMLLIYVSLDNHLYGMAAMYTIFLGTCLYAIDKWRKADRARLSEA